MYHRRIAQIVTVLFFVTVVIWSRSAVLPRRPDPLFTAEKPLDWIQKCRSRVWGHTTLVNTAAGWRFARMGVAASIPPRQA